VNLANELRLLCSQSVLIIDLDEHYGTAASHLGLSGRYGISHVLSRPDAIDGHLIQTGAVSFTQGLDVLLSPAVACEDAMLAMQWENLGRAVDASRHRYRYVVVDAPRLSRGTMADLATTSHIVLVVFQLTVRDISFAKSTIAFLRDQGVAPASILPVANRVKRRGQIVKLREGKDAIGTESLCSIRDDWRKAVRSMNQGRPLAEVAQHSRLRRDFYRLATKIHNGA
jgi:pilus assembly protein CpaE